MKDLLQLAENTYDDLAFEYESRVEEIRPFIIESLPKLLPHITTGKKVLDIGCAVGLHMEMLGQQGYEVTGIDISSKMVEFARRRNPSCEIICGDFMNLDFKEKFDAIYATAFIHLYPKAEVGKVLKRINCLTKNNGVLLVTTTKSSESKEGFFSKGDYEKSRRRFRKFYTREELESTLRSAEFDILDNYQFQDVWGKTWMSYICKKPQTIEK